MTITIYFLVCSSPTSRAILGSSEQVDFIRTFEYRCAEGRAWEYRRHLLGRCLILGFVGVVPFLLTSEEIWALVSSMTQGKTQTAFQLTSRLLYARRFAWCTTPPRPADGSCGPPTATEPCPHPYSTGARSPVGYKGYRWQTRDWPKGRCCLTGRLYHVAHVEPTLQRDDNFQVPCGSLYESRVAGSTKK